MRVHEFEVGQTTGPAIKSDAAGLEPAIADGREHGGKVIVLGELVGLVVEAVIAGDRPVTVGPQEGDAIDAPDDFVVLAGPVAGDQRDVVGSGCIACGISDDQHPAGASDWRVGLGPEGGGVGSEAVERSGERMVSGRIGSSSSTNRGSRPT